LVKGPQVKLKVPLNGTRVGAKHNLLHSELRMNKALKLYEQNYGVPWTPISPEEWRALAEFEAVLNITKLCTTLMQHEQSFAGAFGYIIKQNTISNLHADTLLVADLEKVDKGSVQLPRKLEHDYELSNIGNVCKETH